MMINDYITLTGSTFLSGAFCALLYPQKQEEISKEELKEKIKEIEDFINANPKKNLSLNIIIEKFGCDLKTANLIIKNLYERGIISPIER